MQKLFINDNLISAVRARRNQLAEIFEHIALQKKNQPQGKLKVVKKTRFVQFYHRKSAADKEGTYINKKNLQLAKKLAQKDYNVATEKTIHRQLKVLDSFLANYSEQELAKNYQSCLPQVRQLLEPVALAPEDFIKAWQAVSYEGLLFENNTTEYYTARGERVRSKSEIIIANALLRASIPYRYEFPVTMKGHKSFYPDFFCLNPNDGREIIWEHFGMMDDSEYSKNALTKISCYAENGWILGKNFIYTMETTVAPLSSKFVEKLINEHFA